MSKNFLPEETVIIWNANPIGKYRDFLYQAMGCLYRKCPRTYKNNFLRWRRLPLPT